MFSGVGGHPSLQPAPGLAEPSSTERGIGLDPVFQIWSNLWDLRLTGEEDEYYNMTKVRGQQNGKAKGIAEATQLHKSILQDAMHIVEHT